MDDRTDQSAWSRRPKWLVILIIVALLIVAGVILGWVERFAA